MPYVTLESDDYGSEVFRYDTLDEAVEGYLRLTKSAQKHTDKDGIERDVALHIGKEA